MARFGFGFFCGIVWMATPGFAQHIETTITSPDGQIVSIGPESNYSLAGFSDGELVLTLIPGAHASFASTVIQDGTEQTEMKAKTIVFTPDRERFALHEECVITRSNFALTAPVRVEFDSLTNQMVAEGNADQPAEYTYVSPEGRPVRSSAEAIAFQFQMIDGSRILDKIRVVRGHRSSSIEAGAKQSEKNLFRKSKNLE